MRFETCIIYEGYNEGFSVWFSGNGQGSPGILVHFKTKCWVITRKHLR